MRKPEAPSQASKAVSAEPPTSTAASSAPGLNEQQQSLHSFLDALQGKPVAAIGDPIPDPRAVAPAPLLDTMIPIAHRATTLAPGPVAPTRTRSKKRRKPAEATRILTTGVAASATLMIINVLGASATPFTTAGASVGANNALVPTTMTNGTPGARAITPGAPMSSPPAVAATANAPTAATPTAPAGAAPTARANTAAVSGGSASASPPAAPAPAPNATAAPRPAPTPAPAPPPTTAAPKPAPTTAPPITKTCPSGATKC